MFEIEMKLEFPNFESLVSYATVQNQLFSDFKYLNITGAFEASSLDPTTKPNAVFMEATTSRIYIGCWLSNNLLTLSM